VIVRSGFASLHGTVERWDRSLDLALIRVDDTLPVLVSAYEAGHPPAVGDAVLAYGSPYGLEGTATVGIVSSFRVWDYTPAPTTSRPTHRSIPGTPVARSSMRTVKSSASRARRCREAGSGSPSTSETYAPRYSRGTAPTEQRAICVPDESLASPGVTVVAHLGA